VQYNLVDVGRKHITQSRREVITTEDEMKRKRRFLRFSIRTLLIVLTIFCVALGWKVERARKQREAVAWVHEMGGSVNYDYELDDDGSSAPDAKPPGSEWLRKQLGRDFFDDVVRVSLTEVGVSDVTPLSGLRGSSSNRTRTYAKRRFG
jgi:hypothetical protein